jgi:hypothetical protein
VKRVIGLHMKDRSYFAFRIDVWTDDGENIIEHLAGAEDFTVALATYKAACERWPKAAITLSPYQSIVSPGTRTARHPISDNLDRLSIIIDPTVC